MSAPTPPTPPRGSGVAALREATRVARERYADDTWPRVLAVVAHAHGLEASGSGSESGSESGSGSGSEAAAGASSDPDGLLAAWAERGAAEHLGAVHESLVAGRAASGTYYTPPALVSWMLDRALDPVLDQLPDGVIPDVLDPACGSGAFLLAVVRRVVERRGCRAVDVLPHVHGTDLDPVAVAIARLLLRLEAAPATEVAGTDPRVEVADGLDPGSADGREWDVVLGNPPFRGRLRRRPQAGPTTVPASMRGMAAYTDLSAVFLVDAVRRVRPGGRVALVQPLSLLAARDAGPVRETVREAGTVTDLWTSATPVFPGTAVLTCVPVVERRTTPGAARGAVATWCGPGLTRGADGVLPAREWGPLAAAAFEIPLVRAGPGAGVLGDLAACTADFRDQYYGLVPHVREAGTTSDPAGAAPLVTVGLIGPAACLWGRRPTRFARTAYAAPEVDLASLRAEGVLAAWAQARLVPKVLVATQGRVIEAAVDEHGGWLPSVPVVTVVPPPDRLWHVLAVLLSPPVVAGAAARYLGAALTAVTMKLSARQIAELPLPLHHAAWDRGAEAARAAQTGPSDSRSAALVACAHAMAEAYGETAATTWWLERARIVEEFT